MAGAVEDIALLAFIAADAARAGADERRSTSSFRFIFRCLSSSSACQVRPFKRKMYYAIRGHSRRRRCAERMTTRLWEKGKGGGGESGKHILVTGILPCAMPPSPRPTEAVGRRSVDGRPFSEGSRVRTILPMNNITTVITTLMNKDHTFNE